MADAFATSVSVRRLSPMGYLVAVPCRPGFTLSDSKTLSMSCRLTVWAQITILFPKLVQLDLPYYTLCNRIPGLPAALPRSPLFGPTIMHIFCTFL